MPPSVLIWFLVVSNNTDGMGPRPFRPGRGPPSICERNFTLPARTRRFCEIVRDADKVDIVRVFGESDVLTCWG